MHPEKDYAQHVLENPDSIQNIAVCFYYGRSGSFLLSSLFDDHPQVLSVPPHALTDFVEKVSTFDITRNARIEDIISFVVSSFPYLFCETERTGLHHRYGDEMDEDCGVPQQAFVACMAKSLTSMAQRNIQAQDWYGLIFKIIHISYACAANRRIKSGNPMIFYQCHNYNPYTISILEKLLGQPRFITCVRNPVKTFDSHLVHHLEENPAPPFRELYTSLLTLLFNSGVCVQGIDEKRSCAVRFEDMHADTENLMRALSRWLGIDFDESLLQSTVDGKTYWFPTAGGVYKQGVNPKAAASRGLTILGRTDAIMLRHCLQAYYRDWKYEDAHGTCKDFWVRKCLLYIPPKVMRRLFVSEVWQAIVNRELAELGDLLSRHVYQWGRIRSLYKEKIGKRDTGEHIIHLVDGNTSGET